MGKTDKIITLRERPFAPALGVLVLALVAVMLAACASPEATFTVERSIVPTSQPTETQSSPEGVAASLVGPGAVEANATITSISDGDTVTVSFAGGDESKVRLIGIDTPETKRPNTPIQCFGPEATGFTAALLPKGTRVRIERDVEAIDRYGRLLAYVYRAADGLFINQALAEQGYANLLTYPPNVAHRDQFRDAVDVARQQNRGLWRACPATVSP
jgi:micrococcal nuclease